MAETMRRAAERAHHEAYARDAAEDAWYKYADAASNTISTEQLHPLLKDLDYNRRQMQIGRGLSKTSVTVAALPSDAVFALSELGINDADIKAGARINFKDFIKWYVTKTVGESGDKRNRLLVKPVGGRVKAASYALPGADFCYGAATKTGGPTMKELVSHKFSPDAAGSPKRAASPKKKHADDVVFGGVSAISDSMPHLLRHEYAPKCTDETPYPVHLPEHKSGHMPIPRDTRTSTLRLEKTKHGLTVRDIRETTGKPANESTWKMSRFLEVPPRVPLDGKPLHFPRE